MIEINISGLTHAVDWRMHAKRLFVCESWLCTINFQMNLTTVRLNIEQLGKMQALNYPYAYL